MPWGIMEERLLMEWQWGSRVRDKYFLKTERDREKSATARQCKKEYVRLIIVKRQEIIQMTQKTSSQRTWQKISQVGKDIQIRETCKSN